MLLYVYHSYNLCNCVAEFFPSLKAIRGTLDKRRAKFVPKLPATPEHIDFYRDEITKQFTLTVGGNRIANNRILLFISEHLSESSRWQSDGTFKEAPIIIHG